MKIKREDLLRFYQFRDYIKSCNHRVREVYCSCIYYENIQGAIIDWGMTVIDPPAFDIPCIPIQNDVLRTINALCNTQFQFED